ncbi:MAG: SUMF1/EgtB/PvdO family nonheme iron enzyme, partial [Treponema sp.]|nr:SUMF1/EgtB/PvdO family nonheme iron enzyme [Treponema sp.]
GNATHAVMTAPTGSKDTAKPNTLGIYDMTGNVWEACWDWGGSAYGEAYVYPITPTTGPTGVESGIRRVVRGGSYNYGEAQSYVYYRGVNNEPQDRWENSGFRVVRNIP